MAFTEITFFIFAGLVVLFYYLLPGKFQWIVLLCSSIVFYVSYGVEKLIFIVAAAFIAWRSAQKMEEIQTIKELDRNEIRAKKKMILVPTIIVLILLLLYAKIGTWAMQSIAGIFSIRSEETFKAVVALGVSYYTFSIIGYLLDVYYKKEAAEHNFFRFFLFVIYFPKILQGPISRHKALAPQLKQVHIFDYKEFCFGFQRVLWGYFKKMVISDRLALFVTPVFDDYIIQSGAHLFVAACLAALQLYCDFSGCMDIVGGFSQILGLKLEENFNHPFFSRSTAEFWRRWHITLGAWFKDYVYMPLVISPKLISFSKVIRDKFGMRAGKSVMTVIPLLVVWLLTGLWHSTGWNYVVWGLYWGALIIGANVFAPEIKKLTERLCINTDAESWKIFQMVRTFMLFAIGRILTIPGDLGKSMRIFKNIFFRFQIGTLFDGSLYTQGMDRPDFILSMVCILILWLVSIHQEKEQVRESLLKCNIVFRWAVWYILLFSIVIFGIYGPGYGATSFVYANY